MMSPDLLHKQQTQHSSEFMLQEFERLEQLRIDTIRQAEQRVNFFLTIVSAAIGGLIVLAQIGNIPSANFLLATQAILSILLTYGINMLNRLASREVRLAVISQLRRGVQDYFACRDPEIADYVNLERQAFTPAKRKTKIFLFFTIFRGGLVELIIITNSLLCAGVILTVLFHRGYHAFSIIIWMLITIILSTIALYG